MIYQICTRCIMDTSDPEIKFDETGVCFHCHRYEEVSRVLKTPMPDRQESLGRLVEWIKAEGQGKRYDCIIGVSGGVDSSYVAYLVRQLGLRPLAVHLDNGWNSELAVSNVEKLLNKLGIDLFTQVLDWEEFKDLQVAFLRASTPDSEIPTDHAIFALLYQVAAREGLKYIISGTNLATEAIMPKRWSHGHSDWKYIRTIQKRFGKVKLKSFPHYSLTQFLFHKLVRRIQWVPLLNYYDYRKKEAVGILEKDLGWRHYGGKHYESIYTRFFQGYILPTKFKFDKRRAHLSSLICSGQISREEALREIQEPADTPEKIRENTEFVIKKLGLTVEEFHEIMSSPTKTFWEYPSYDRDSVLFKAAKSAYRVIHRNWGWGV